MEKRRYKPRRLMRDGQEIVFNYRSQVRGGRITFKAYKCKVVVFPDQPNTPYLRAITSLSFSDTWFVPQLKESGVGYVYIKVTARKAVMELETKMRQRNRAGKRAG